MAAVQLESAMTAFAGIFPAGAPEPTLPDLTDVWRERIGCAGASTSVVLASLDGLTIGTAMGQPDPADPDRGHLRSLYVMPEYWQRGIGRALHDVVLRRLGISGFALASLWVLERNESARTRYEQWGWQLSTARQEIYSGVHEVRYLREL